jgi:SAM-dependent methyltransferase
MPGTHQRFLPFFQAHAFPIGSRVLDIGAGHGAFAKRLYDLGYQVDACDLFPEIFHFDAIECRQVDIISGFPYEDGSFDMAVSIEVMEHIYDHERFFAEAHRILKPGGRLFLSTPNILSLKSRMRFLLSGFPYSFKPLDHANHDGLQHVAALSLDQFNYVATKHGFKPAVVSIDRRQRGSMWLMALLWPWLQLFTRAKRIEPIHNQTDLLLGRLLFLQYEKAAR